MLPIKVYAALWLAGAVMLATSKPSHSAGLAGIGNATVNEGQLVTHLREVFIQDDKNRNNLDNRWRQRFMVDYGFTDWFASGIYIQSDRRNRDDHELEALIWDSRVELTTVPEDGFYSGFRVRYTYRDGDKKPDNLHLRTIVGVPIGNWELRANPIFYTDLGPDSRAGMGIDLRTQVTYGYAEGHRAGIESFWDFGKLRDLDGYQNQTHYVGGVMLGNVTPEWGYETGYAYGMTNTAPDHTFKLFLIRYF